MGGVNAYSHYLTHVHDNGNDAMHNITPIGSLLHVPITKYKIIPNPNPNTKMTVNTITRQM